MNTQELITDLERISRECANGRPINGGDLERIDDAAQALTTSQEREGVLRGALIRLRDCDFVITPRDRMDAVRGIARQALQSTEQQG